MYSKMEASLIRKKFWTSFGQYLRPLPGADGEPVHWLNYKTGIKDLYFRMDADHKQAAVCIELRHPDLSLQQQYFEQLQQLKKILENITGEPWQWKLHQPDDNGNRVSRNSSTLEKVSIFNTHDWPAIISFLKARIIALDEFWNLVKDGFE